MSSPLNNLTNKQAQSLIKPLEKSFKSLPHLPRGIVDFIVGITPWLVLLGGVFSVLGAVSLLLSSFTTSTFMGQFMRYYQYSRSYFLVSSISELIMGGLLLLAFKPLQNRKIAGWMLLFWVNVVSLVHQGFTLFMGYHSILGFVISAVIGFYLLFELKPSYK